MPPRLGPAGIILLLPSSLLPCQQCPCCEDMATPYIGFQQCSGVTGSHQGALLPTRKSLPLPYLPGKCWDWEISAVLPSPFASIQILSFCSYKKSSCLNLFIFIHDDLCPPVLIPSTCTPLANDNPEAGLESAVNLWFLGLRAGRSPMSNILPNRLADCRGLKCYRLRAKISSGYSQALDRHSLLPSMSDLTFCSVLTPSFHQPKG